MIKYILKRIGLLLLTLLIIMTMCFFLIKSLPLTVRASIGQDAERIEALIQARGYRDPILKQYFTYLGRILQGDWGVGINMETNASVSEVFAKRLPATMLINVYAMIFSVPIGLGLGIFAALKKNKWQDHVISTGVMIFISVPSYVYAFLVQYIFCFKMGLPTVMSSLVEAGGSWLSWKMFVSTIPPVLALSFGTIAGFARYTRAELTEVLTSEFMLLARTKGLTRGQATLRHALRNAMVPIFPMILGEFVGIIGGSLIIEQIFAVPGVGRLYLSSITALDYDFFMMLSTFYTFVGLAAGIIVDISYGIIDPRIRMGAR